MTGREVTIIADLESACGTTSGQWTEEDWHASGHLLRRFTAAEIAHLADLASRTTGWDAVCPAEVLAVAT